MQTQESPLTPELIRRWRGERSRAEAARAVGVSALTVYRWELPDSAAEARRPRGEVARRLRALLGAGVLGSGASPGEAEPLAGWRRRRSEGRLAEVEEEIVGALGAGALPSRAGQAAAAAELALLRLVSRGDVPAALTTLAPWLAPGEELLPTEVRARLYAVDAWAAAQPHGTFIDAERAARRLGQLRALGPVGTWPDLDLLARATETSIAFYSSDHAAHRDAPLPEPAPEWGPLEHAMAAELGGHLSFLRGRPTESMALLSDASARYQRHGFDYYAGRVEIFRGLRLLDDAHAPADALAAAARARELLGSVSPAPGQHLLLLGRVEGEGFLRLGRFAEAETALRSALVAAESARWPPHSLASTFLRLLAYTGRFDEALEHARALQRAATRVQADLTRAFGRLQEAWLLFLLGQKPERAAELAGRIVDEVQARRAWLFFEREARSRHVGMLIRLGQVEEAGAALAALERLLERNPSAWWSAFARRHRGMLDLALGEADTALRHLEASRAAFQVAGDEPEAAITTHLLALAAHRLGHGDAALRLAEAEAAFATLGMVLPEPLEEAVASVLRTAAPRPSAGPDLSLPVARLTLRGLDGRRIASELVDVVVGLGQPGAVRVEEELAAGPAVWAERGAEPAPREGATGPWHWFDLGDGTGRPLRLGLAEAPAPELRDALQVLLPLVGLAMEVAALRGYTPRPAEPLPDEAFVAVSAPMRRLRGEIERLAGSRATVLLTGESGVGKEVLARAIHERSARAGRPLVAFNCAAVPRELFEGQLFGHRRGAFTGAQSDNPGVLRAGDGGTVFLDEVGELPLDVQPKLLRFLENGEVLPLGERRPVRVDVRVIAATNRDLAREVTASRFREDLYYRLAVVPLRVPPLRERPEDVPALARLFLRQLTPPGQPLPVLGADAVAALRARPWPGNARELRNVIERVVAFSPVPAVIGARELGG